MHPNCVNIYPLLIVKENNQFLGKINKRIQKIEKIIISNNGKILKFDEALGGS